MLHDYHYESEITKVYKLIMKKLQCVNLAVQVIIAILKEKSLLSQWNIYVATCM